MLKSSVSHYGADMIALREKLITLRDNYGLVGVKGGTEVEAMSFEEIKFLKQVSKGIVPLTVKIGGPEARNDVEFMLSIGTEVILAPMIESVYSLKNFVDMMKSIDSERSSALAINIETITAYKSLEEIFGSIYFNSIHSVTVGRTDLSGSVDMDVDDDFVMKMTYNIVRLARYFNKKTSVGGKVDTMNANSIKNIIQSEYLNTRHMIVKNSQEDISKAVEAALDWEAQLYQKMSDFFPLRKSFYDARINSIFNRKSKISAAGGGIAVNEDAKCTCR